MNKLIKNAIASIHEPIKFKDFENFNFLNCQLIEAINICIKTNAGQKILHVCISKILKFQNYLFLQEIVSIIELLDVDSDLSNELCRHIIENFYRFNFPLEFVKLLQKCISSHGFDNDTFYVYNKLLLIMAETNDDYILKSVKKCISLIIEEKDVNNNKINFLLPILSTYNKCVSSKEFDEKLTHLFLSEFINSESKALYLLFDYLLEKNFHLMMNTYIDHEKNSESTYDKIFTFIMNQNFEKLNTDATEKSLLYHYFNHQNLNGNFIENFTLFYKFTRENLISLSCVIERDVFNLIQTLNQQTFLKLWEFVFERIENVKDKCLDDFILYIVECFCNCLILPCFDMKNFGHTIVQKSNFVVDLKLVDILKNFLEISEFDKNKDLFYSKKLNLLTNLVKILFSSYLCKKFKEIDDAVKNMINILINITGLEKIKLIEIDSSLLFMLYIMINCPQFSNINPEINKISQLSKTIQVVLLGCDLKDLKIGSNLIFDSCDTLVVKNKKNRFIYFCLINQRCLYDIFIMKCVQSHEEFYLIYLLNYAFVNQNNLKNEQIPIKNQDLSKIYSNFFNSIQNSLKPCLGLAMDRFNLFIKFFHIEESFNVEISSLFAIWKGHTDAFLESNESNIFVKKVDLFFLNFINSFNFENSASQIMKEMETIDHPFITMWFFKFVYTFVQKTKTNYEKVWKLVNEQYSLYFQLFINKMNPPLKDLNLCSIHINIYQNYMKLVKFLWNKLDEKFIHDFDNFICLLEKTHLFLLNICENSDCFPDRPTKLNKLALYCDKIKNVQPFVKLIHEQYPNLKKFKKSHKNLCRHLKFTVNLLKAKISETKDVVYSQNWENIDTKYLTDTETVLLKNIYDMKGDLNPSFKRFINRFLNENMSSHYFTFLIIFKESVIHLYNEFSPQYVYLSIVYIFDEIHAINCICVKCSKNPRDQLTLLTKLYEICSSICKHVDQSNVQFLAIFLKRSIGKLYAAFECIQHIGHSDLIESFDLALKEFFQSLSHCGKNEYCGFIVHYIPQILQNIINANQLENVNMSLYFNIFKYLITGIPITKITQAYGEISDVHKFMLGKIYTNLDIKLTTNVKRASYNQHQTSCKIKKILE